MRLYFVNKQYHAVQAAIVVFTQIFMLGALMSGQSNLLV